MWLEDYCEDCETHLGAPWKIVHEFLDQYAQVFNVNFFMAYHRSFLHNEYGLRIIRAMWGEEAWKAAAIHLLADWHESPMARKSWNFIVANLPIALKTMNQFDNMDPMISPNIISAWKGKGLVAMSMEEK